MENETPKAAPAPATDGTPKKQPKLRNAAPKLLVSKEKKSKPKKEKDPNLHAGHVLKISVGAGQAAAVELVSKKGGRQSFALADENSGTVSARIALAAAALVSGAKLHILSRPMDGGGLGVASLEMRAKRQA